MGTETIAESNGTFEVPIGQLVHSTTTPRQVIDKARDKELADSIREQGIIQPIVVRPIFEEGAHKTETFEIVAGGRRFDAAKAAGLEVVPIRIMQLTDDQALEVQVIENLQRQDIHPLDEAAGYAAILKQGKFDVTELASKVGRDASYIYRRMKLNDLRDSARKMLAEGKLPVSHAELLARLQLEDQDRALEYLDGESYDDRMVPYDELRSFVTREVLLVLNKAPFPLKATHLVPEAGSCDACPKRTRNDRLLFPEVGKDDRCTDPACFQAKRRAFLESKLDGVNQKRIQISTADYYDSRGCVDIEGKRTKKVTGAEKWKDAKKNPCKHAQEAIVVSGHKSVGQVKTVCVTPSCKRHFPGQQANRRTSEQVTADSKKRELAQQEDVHAETEKLRAFMGKLRGKTLPAGFVRILLELLSDLFDEEQEQILAAAGCTELAAKFKAKSEYDVIGPLVKSGKLGQHQELSLLVAGTLATDMRCHWGTRPHVALAKNLRLDLKAIEKRARKEFRAKYKADEKAKRKSEQAAKKKGAKKKRKAKAKSKPKARKKKGGR